MWCETASASWWRTSTKPNPTTSPTSTRGTRAPPHAHTQHTHTHAHAHTEDSPPHTHARTSPGTRRSVCGWWSWPTAGGRWSTCSTPCPVPASSRTSSCPRASSKVPCCPSLRSLARFVLFFGEGGLTTRSDLFWRSRRCDRGEQGASGVLHRRRHLHRDRRHPLALAARRYAPPCQRARGGRTQLTARARTHTHTQPDNREYIIATTKLINGDTLLSSLMENIEVFLPA